MSLSPSFTRPYPLVIDHGEGSWVTDVDGNVFLDFTSGIAVNATGHAHPAIRAAIARQTERFLHMSGTDFYYEPEIALAERLVDLAPVAPRARALFTNSGAESIEASIKLARWATGRPNFLAFSGAFHGRTMGALSLTGSKASQRHGFEPLMPGVYHVPYPALCRGISTADVMARIEEVFQTVASPSTFAGVFVEPVQGEGGYLVPPPDFLPELRRLTEEHGILLVVDEIQTGIGRTGCMFALEHSGVRADIVTMAKGIASGLPLGAMVAGRDLMSWPPGSHGSTFGGNPVSCAAALATLELVEQGLMQNAATRGQQLLAGLGEIAARRRDVVDDVRGLGLMTAVECRTPAQVNPVIQAAFHRGLLLLPAGRRAIRLIPSLTVSEGEVDTAMEILDESMRDAALRYSHSAAN